MANPTLSTTAVLAAQLGALKAAYALALNLGEFGPRYDHTKCAAFQAAFNMAISAAGQPQASITVDGNYGSHTATALVSVLTTVAPGLPSIPTSASLVPTWWNAAKASIAQAVTARMAQLAQAISQSVPVNATGEQAAQVIDAATSGAVATTAAIGAQASHDGPGGTSTSSSSGSAGGPISLPAEYITAPAPRSVGLSWPWIVGGVALASIGAVLAWGAWKRRGAGKRRRKLVRAA